MKTKRKKSTKKKVAKRAKATSNTRYARREKRTEAVRLSLDEQVGRLERFVATLARQTYSSKLLATSKDFAAEAAVDGDVVDLRLKKLGTSPDLVRVTLRGRGNLVLAPGAAEGVVTNVVVGIFIELVIEVTGNPGDTASIAVTGAIPNSINVGIPTNTGQTIAIRSLLVTG